MAGQAGMAPGRRNQLRAAGLALKQCGYKVAMIGFGRNRRTRSHSRWTGGPRMALTKTSGIASPEEAATAVFGPISRNVTDLKTWARLSPQKFVRSQTQIARWSPEAKGRSISAHEAFSAFGLASAEPACRQHERSHCPEGLRCSDGSPDEARSHWLHEAAGSGQGQCSARGP